jgi:hypothetical protein
LLQKNSSAARIWTADGQLAPQRHGLKARWRS